MDLKGKRSVFNSKKDVYERTNLNDIRSREEDYDRNRC